MNELEGIKPGSGCFGEAEWAKRYEEVPEKDIIEFEFMLEIGRRCATCLFNTNVTPPRKNEASKPWCPYAYNAKITEIQNLHAEFEKKTYRME